jgi:hypothetical protein
VQTFRRIHFRAARLLDGFPPGKLKATWASTAVALSGGWDRLDPYPSTRAVVLNSVVVQWVLRKSLVDRRNVLPSLPMIGV